MVTVSRDRPEVDESGYKEPVRRQIRVGSGEPWCKKGSLWLRQFKGGTWVSGLSWVS